MPKSSQTKIEEDERMVMRLLQQDARQSIDKMAKTCKFSRQKVWRIIKRLDNNKAIWGYPAVVDDDMFDHRRFQILVKRTQSYISADALETIIKRKLEKTAVEYDITILDSLFTHGRYDWVFTITASDIRSVKKFVEAFQQMFSGYVESIDILEVLFPVKKNGIQNPDITSIKDYF
ncbi:MAG: Lrp/AsnC family transcriptional regulator [Candidatus Thermoplasmatota archaeon]|nr:Lrp/AsnC family transcriptional regulator [Candidatus Thermoplasmatota archaeon]